MKTPVVLIIFNRPDFTQQVFEAIKAAKPEKLLVIADGPRNDTEAKRCADTRSIINQVDWNCEVSKFYSEKNIGCRPFLAQGLNWVFEQVERAIVFEADCLPHPTFFRFCEELLEKYADDSKIMHISGNFFQQRNPAFSSTDSYYFSIIPHIWGWATWRRAWKQYDPDLKQWPEIKENKTIAKTLTNPAAYEYWETIWDQYYDRKIESWDGQWTFACLLAGGLSINPTKNLVTNIGFGPEAMHTIDPNSIFANVPLKAMTFPLTHPEIIRADTSADTFTLRQNFGIDAKLRQRILGRIRRTFPKPYGFLRFQIRKLFGK